MINHVWAVANKDLRLFFADKKAMIISFLVPIIIASFFSFVMVGNGGGGKQASKIPILAVNEDDDPLTATLIQKLGKSDMISVETVTREAATTAVKEGKSGVAVIFPKGFSAKAKSAIFAGDPATLEELYDPTKGTDKQVAQGALMQTLMQEISKEAMTGDSAKANLERALSFETDPVRKRAWKGMMDSWSSLDKSGGMSGGTGGGMRTPFEIKGQSMTAAKDDNADVNAGKAHVFGGMAMQGLLFFAINAAIGMLRDRKTGVWSRMKAAPVSSMALVLGNGLSTAIIAFIIFCGVMAFGVLALGIRVYGSWLGLGLVAICSSIMTAGYGLLIASLGKTEEQARGYSMIATLMMLMLGGAWFPTFLMPPFMQTISKIMPVRWSIDGVDAMVFRGAGLTSAVTPMVVTLGFAAGFSAIAIARMRKQ